MSSLDSHHTSLTIKLKDTHPIQLSVGLTSHFRKNSIKRNLSYADQYPVNYTTSRAFIISLSLINVYVKEQYLIKSDQQLDRDNITNSPQHIQSKTVRM